MSRKNMLTIKEISKRYKVSEATIRHYIDLDLIRVYKREGGKWYFRKNEVDARIKKIRNLLRQGYLLRQMRKKLNKG